MNAQQLELFRRYYDTGMPGESTKAEQEQILNGQFGGDFNAYAEWWVNWWLNEAKNNPDALDQYPDSVQILGQLADAGYAPATTVLQSGGYEKTPDTSPVPLEQGLLQTVLPRVTNDINADMGRTTLANNIGNQAVTATQGAMDLLSRTQGGGFNATDYLNRYPGLVNEVFAKLNDGATQGTKSVPTSSGPKDMTPEQFAEWHFLNVGQREGLTANYTPSAQLAQDFSNADQFTQANIAAANDALKSQLASLQTTTDALQGNLTGELAAKAAALQQQIAALNANLDQLDATQRKALTDQIAAQQANLEQSIATQRQALQEQVTALGAAVGAEAQAKRAALQQEIAGLTAAQEPLAVARTQAAELQATAVNVGLERTKDQLVADAARDGYVGGSTIQDAALARATIGARQQAAQAISNARVQNATDTRDIGVRGATGERSIADALAQANREVATTGATGNFDLTSAFAKGRQALGDAGAVGTAAITNSTAQSRAGIGAMGANQTFQDQVAGASQKRSILDALATGTNSLNTANSNNILEARQAGNAAKAAYYDNDYARKLSGAMAMTTLPQNLTSTLTGLDNYANSGLTRGLNTLNWWSTNQGAAPTPGATAVQPDTTGNSLSGLGSGLMSGAIQAGLGYANSRNWWQTPKVPATSAAPGGINAGGSNLYTTPLT